MAKKIVIKEASGLFRIVGEEPEVEGFVRPELVATSEDGSTMIGLVAVKPRYVLYKELVAPPQVGKLNEFHPDQV